MIVSAWVMGLSLHLNDVCLWWRTAKNKLFSTKYRTRWEETWVYVQNYTQCIKRINTNIVKYDKSSSDADMLWSRSETLAVAVKPLYYTWFDEKNRVSEAKPNSSGLKENLPPCGTKYSGDQIIVRSLMDVQCAVTFRRCIICNPLTQASPQIFAKQVTIEFNAFNHVIYIFTLYSCTT